MGSCAFIRQLACNHSGDDLITQNARATFAFWRLEMLSIPIQASLCTVTRLYLIIQMERVVRVFY